MPLPPAQIVVLTRQPIRANRAEDIQVERIFQRHRAMRLLRLSMAAAAALVAYDWPATCASSSG